MRKGEFKKNKVIDMTILIFVILASMLMTVGTIVITQTSNSMQTIFEIAKPPHFLQMHSGDVNQEKIEAFTEQVTYVTAEETVEMQNIDSASIWYQKEPKDGENLVSMCGNMMDNGFVKQNSKFDFLLDENNEIIRQEKGNIGVPISYREEYDLQIGDKVILSQGNMHREYRIANFVRDAQMASSMASSTRFLLSDEDYAALKGQIGEAEYIVEFRFTDSGFASKFQQLYEAAESDMPKNGQAITYPLIKLVNALSSGLTAGMLILISLVLILIAAVVLKYTILASLEEEIYEIGVLKAIGISDRDIQKQYVSKYRILAVTGCIAGYGLGILGSPVFTKGIQTMFGSRQPDILDFALSVLTVWLVYLLMLHNTKKVLKRIRKITVVQALVRGETGVKKEKQKAGAFSIQKYGTRHINGYLGIQELLAEKRMWVLIVFVFLLAVNVILNPINLIHTFQAPEFANYMGTADSDVQVIVQAQEQPEEKCRRVLAEIQKDGRIRDAAVYSVKKYEVLGTDEKEMIQLESGDYSKFAANCIEGRMPQKSGEIAISYLNQKKFGKKTGDQICILKDGQEVSYNICGVYQDITSGGYTAKAFSNTWVKDAQIYSILFDCQNKADIVKIAADYDRNYEFAKALPMEEYCKQTFGSVASSFANAGLAVVVVAVLIVILILVLFLKLQGAKKQKEFIMLRVMGFESKDLSKQYILKSTVAAGVGIVLGIVLANTLGAELIGMALSLAGLEIAHFRYISDIWVNGLACPIGMLLLAAIVTKAYMNVSQKEQDIRIMQD